MVSGKIFDNDLTILSICSDFCDAKNQGYFDINRKKYNVAFLPSCHRLYTGRLLAAGYHLLGSSKNKNLSLIYLGKKSNFIKIYSGDINFMGKIWKFDDLFSGNFDLNIEICDDYFVDFYSQLPYIRILSDYQKIFVFEIGENIDKKLLKYFFSFLYSLGNIAFISDLHSGFPLSECEELDEASINLNNDDLPVLNRFFSLLKDKRKKSQFLGYGNTYDLNGNTKNTTGFCSFVF